MSETSLDIYPPNCKCFHPVTHVIFDLDGTLVDTETINQSIWESVVEKNGKVLPDDFTMRFRGASMMHTLKELINELNIDSTVEELKEDASLIENEIFGSIPCNLMKGAKKLIKHFDRHLIPMAIGTSSSKFQADLKIKAHEKLFSMIHHVVTCDDANYRCKPLPDIYLLAARRFPSRPKNSSCLTFEDTPNGLKAAVAAGMQCVFIPQIEVDEEIQKLATITIKSLEDFEPELFGLPPIGRRKALNFIGK
jgi:pseudouridine-5'-monophosphatase